MVVIFFEARATHRLSAAGSASTTVTETPRVAARSLAMTEPTMPPPSTTAFRLPLVRGLRADFLVVVFFAIGEG